MQRSHGFGPDFDDGAPRRTASRRQRGTWAPGAVLVVTVGLTVGLTGCPAESPDSKPAPPPDAASAPPAKAGSQPGSQPSSLPAGHSTSSSAVSLAELFAMPETKDDTVLEVGNRKVKREALEHQLRQTQVQLSATGIPSHISRQQVLQGAVDQLVERELRNLLADELGVKADPEFEKAWLADMEKRIAAQPQFKVFLLRAGKNKAQRAKDAHAAAVMNAVVQKIKEQAKADTETEAKAYYEKRKTDFLERGGRETWRIFIKAPRGMIQRDRDIAKARAEGIRKKALANPERFRSLAISHSEGGKASEGGYIGWIGPKTLAPKLEKQIMAAKPNTILPLWEDASGFFVYKVGRSRKDRQASFDEVKHVIFDKVYRKTISTKVDAELERLRAKYPPVVHIAELKKKP